METAAHHASAGVTHFIGKEIQNRIEQHPCYSKKASNYARIHLPVAPACNIQCNYCNRKYDCSNESRPGVVSKVLQPIDGLARFHSIKQHMPNLSVVGIAGPGDALANPKVTLETLKLIREDDPSVKLCISTNGLELAQYAPQLAAIGVDHLTITINTIDEKIASKIYPWIFWNHKRYKGIEAARILIEQQLKGLEAAIEQGMLVKVNTVLIPGINDQSITQLSKALKQRGAFLHNIMPLISEPEHGTYYGLNEMPSPTEQQIEEARSQSVLYLPQMSHCQQCRADAVGQLDAACSSKDDAQSTRVAIASKGTDIIECHFGHATQMNIYDINQHEIRFVESRMVAPYCSGPQDCERPMPVEAIKDCQHLLSVRVGLGPWEELENMGIIPNTDFAYLSEREALSTLAQTINANNLSANKEVG
ncbi:nitrogenase cofactor biosynthesis protein NifB [Vibrio astriarenae]|uniref:FeMo cofactor biosynthesis protein NifB n=1 Tax=Vibrio astriarenae TaxID=1481923 RepID=A0A7Z2YDI0_9VIBR|nr:nitrogenase cofactor biosynthesis protein NifB [Vibrio astriarenae]QIA63169.1 nitrogenase cofactor biosynthesis protein NifB [Vibrio astriarenae]